jgi:ankyrin repeat protein
VATSFLIDRLQLPAQQMSMPVTICYYFCDDKNECQRHAASALCGILHQLMSARPALLTYALGMHQAKGRRMTEEPKTLWDILLTALADPLAENVMLVIDALDECEERSRQQLLKWVMDLAVASQQTGAASPRGLKMLLTSRREFLIASALDTIAVELRMEDELHSVERDIRTVVAKKLESRGYSAELKREIENQVMEKADGTFLWVALTLRVLDESGDSSYDGLMDTLRHARSGSDLFSVYADILDGIPPARRTEARKVLLIAATAVRPLTLDEFNLALAVRPADRSERTLARRLQQDLPRRLLWLCGPFLRIVDMRVHLVHQTAKEFLLSSSHAPAFWVLDRAESHLVLAEICMSYLNFDCFAAAPPSRNTNALQSVDAGKPVEGSHSTEARLLKYAAVNWTTHFREAQLNGDITMIRLARHIHCTGSPRFGVWFELFWQASSYWGAPPTQMTALISASMVGHTSVAALLLAEPSVAVNSRDDTGSTALLWACRTGYDAVADLLLRHDNLYINAHDIDRRTPLWWAAWGGHHATVQTLLAYAGVDINAADVVSQTALLVAAWNGHEGVVELLLQHADIRADAADDQGYTPLARAASRAHVPVAQLLLAHGHAEPNSFDKDGRTPLSRAAERGHVNMVQLLLGRTDIDCDAVDKEGRTPLSLAAEAGHAAVAELLLSDGHALADRADNEGQTPLYWAAGAGQEAVVRLLVARDDVDVNAEDGDGQTPLSRAAERGHASIVRLLLTRRDVSVNARDCDNRTPLWWAAEGGHEDVVWLLLNNDAVEVGAQDGVGRTAIDIAEANGHVDVAALLRAHFLSLNEVDKARKGNVPQTAEAAEEIGEQQRSSSRFRGRSQQKSQMKAIVSWWPMLRRALV